MLLPEQLVLIAGFISASEVIYLTLNLGIFKLELIVFSDEAFIELCILVRLDEVALALIY